MSVSHDWLSTGLMSIGTFMGVPQGLLSSEFINSSSTPPPPATEIKSPFIDFDPIQQVIVVDDDEESWLQLLSRSRKKLVAEGEL
jgi:hypothetical protein